MKIFGPDSATDRWAELTRHKPWLVLYVLIGTATLSVAVAAWTFWEQHQRFEELTHQEQSLSQALASKRAAVGSGPASSKDFTHGLPQHVAPALVLEEMRRACAEAGVAWMELQSQERPANLQQLGLVQMNFQLRGGYVAIKQVLQEVQARYSFATVHALALKRLGPAGSTELEATLRLSRWSQPLRAGGAEGAEGPGR